MEVENQVEKRMENGIGTEILCVYTSRLEGSSLSPGSRREGVSSGTPLSICLLISFSPRFCSFTSDLFAVFPKIGVYSKLTC